MLTIQHYAVPESWVNSRDIDSGGWLGYFNIGEPEKWALQIVFNQSDARQLASVLRTAADAVIDTLIPAPKAKEEPAALAPATEGAQEG